jgi:peroxiredoxin
VKVYNQYRHQNFEILGIAFDKRKDKWIDAIKADGLEWPQVSDLKYFDSEMIELYGIVNVPTTILLDPEGKIVALDLHAIELEKLLGEVL